MPFRVAWTDAIGSPGFTREFLSFHRGLREAWRPSKWTLNLAVFSGGEPLGSQSLGAHGFLERREVETGSWLGSRFQRRGYGTEMRAAVLELAFAGLGAGAARSGYLEGNEASARVSEKLGYRQAGEGTAAPRGKPVREIQMRLERERWEASPRWPVAIAGLEPCLPLFGLGA
jgi:RimJ/RimL family protein N-acetyltransferase